MLAKIEFRLRTRNLFTVSTGHSVSPAYADLVFTKKHVIIDRRLVEVPIIPGSSLKGVFRKIVSRLVPDSCMSVATRDLLSGLTCGELVKLGLRQDVCSVCKCFGTTEVPGLIEVSDAIPDENFLKVFAETSFTQKYTHVSISRYTRTAEESALWTREVVPCNVTFRGYALCHYSEDYICCLRLLLIALGLLRFYNVGRGGSVEVVEVRIAPREVYERALEIVREVGLDKLLNITSST